MNAIDALIIILFALLIVRWVRIGLVQGVFSLGAILGGLFTGLLLAPFGTKYFTEPTERFLAALAIIAISILVFEAVFELIGGKVSTHIVSERAKKLNAILGGVFSVFFGFVLVWLGAAILVSTAQFSGVAKEIEHSYIVRLANQNLPAAPATLARLNNLISPLEFPKVFVGGTPTLAEPVTQASNATVQAAVKSAGASTVRVESPGCGGIIYGSGFVADDDLVMTNAHVVAGTRNVYVSTTKGRLSARVVYFNPDLDVAVLRTDRDINIKALPIVSSVQPRGTQAVVLGFPGGGDFSAEAAGITRNMQARGLNIYSSRLVTRDIYELQARVVQGNSGGPLVTASGDVVGLIFAASPDGNAIGYALSSPQLNTILGEARNNSRTVSTQTCAKE